MAAKLVSSIQETTHRSRVGWWRYQRLSQSCRRPDTAACRELHAFCFPSNIIWINKSCKMQQAGHVTHTMHTEFGAETW